MANLTLEDDMRNLVGSKVEVYFKNSEGNIADLSGILTHVDDRQIYLQADNYIDKVLVVPRENVLYYATTKTPSDNNLLMFGNKNNQDDLGGYDNTQDNPSITSVLRVVVDKTFSESIEMPAGFSLDSWHDDIMQIALDNPRVQIMLKKKVQKSAEYLISDSTYAELHIYTKESPLRKDLNDQGVEPQQDTPTDTYQSDDQQNIQGDNTFAMSSSGSPMANQYLNPSDMVSKLNNIPIKKKRVNDE